MPSKKPKISAYVPPELYEWLLKYQKSRKITSISKAAIQALLEYQSMLEQTEDQVKANKEQVLAEIRGEIEDLQQQIKQLSTLQERIERLADQVKLLEEE